MSALQEHWDRAYTAKAETEVSWFQPVLANSLQLIRGTTSGLRASVIDIGGGASTLPDSLLDLGFDDVTVLDISATALARARRRMAARADRVNWVVADITAWQPSRTWDAWHDRAVFHFLTDGQMQDRYIAALRQGTYPGSTAIMSTFALDGPERCSGLPVQRYSAASLAERIGAPFMLVDQQAEHHVTPGGTEQRFIYAVLKRQ